MNELGYNQLMRALKHFDYKSQRKIPVSKMNEIFDEMMIFVDVS